MAFHFFRLKEFIDQDQAANQLTDRPRAGIIIRDPCMGNSSTVKAEEVCVLCDQNSLLASGKRQLFLIRRSAKPYFLRGRNVDASASQTFSHGGGHAFVQVEADLGGHVLSLNVFSFSCKREGVLRRKVAA